MTLLALVLSQVSLCPAGWEPLSTPGCFKRGAKAGVIVYLHGMMAPNEKVFARELGFVAPATTKAGVTVIALPARRASATGRPNTKTGGAGRR